MDLGLGARVEEGGGAGAERRERVGRADSRHALADALEQLALDLLVGRLEQALLPAEVVVERAARHARGADDLLRAHTGEAAGGEQRACRGDERGAGGVGALGVLGLAFHTACMQNTYSLYVI
jgi:hypothetical protein